MKLYRVVPVVVLLFVFIFTNLASAYSAPSLAALTTQLQGLLLQLHALLSGGYELTAGAVSVPVAPRTCQVGVFTRVNGVEVVATTTMTGETTDHFAIALSVGTGTQNLPYSHLVQSKMWGKGSLTGTAGYFTPSDYEMNKSNLALLATDVRYKVLAVPLDNVNDARTGTIFSTSTPYAEALITNDAAGVDIPAGKVSVRVNISSCTQSTQIPVQNLSKPNILLVQVDDLDLQTMAKLPRLKALMADKGVTFTNAFTSYPLPASLLTGKFAHNTNGLTGTTDSEYTNFVQSGNENNTVAAWLKNAGYKTALMGKYMNGYDAGASGVTYAVPTGWTDWVVPLQGNPYSQYNYTLNVNGVPEKHYLKNCTDELAKSASCNEYVTAALGDKQAHYMLNVLGKKAKDYVTANAKTGTPFFLALTPFVPHTPVTIASRYEYLLASSTWLANHPLIKTASFNEAVVSDKPAWLVNNAPLLATSSFATLESMYQRRLVSLYAIEDMMIGLVDTLTANHQLDNTYIIFTSQNGYHLGQHRMASGKGTEFDTDIHIPLLIRGPKIMPGTKNAQITANVDLAPTVASLANVIIPAASDGRSLKETLVTATAPTRFALLLEHGTSTLKRTRVNTPGIPPGYTWNYARPASVLATSEPADTIAIDPAEQVGEYRGIRTAQYTYIRYTQNNEEELYDNVNDPEQLQNVAPFASPTLLERLRTWTDDLTRCSGDSCRVIESENRLNGDALSGLDGKACFAGVTQVNNGTSYTFYSKRTVEPKASCDLVKQVRTCADGKLSGSAAYTINSCTVLNRFTGVNMNHNPQDLDLSLMNQTGATWMRAIFDTVKYASSTTYNFENWENFKKASTTMGKKGVINIMWDFKLDAGPNGEPQGEHVPKPNSFREQQLFTYLDTKVLPVLLPYAEIIVVGNEPFKDTLSEDWVYDQSLGGTPIAIFFKRAADHIQNFMLSQPATSPLARSKHKLYLGAFTQLYSPISRITKVPGRPDVVGNAGQAVHEMLTFAANSPFIDGVDFHTHILNVQQIEDSLQYISQYTDKPVTDTEYSYAQAQGLHLQESLDAGDTHPFAGGVSFVMSTSTLVGDRHKYLGTMTVIDYLLQAQKTPVSKDEWDNFFRSRSWTIDHFIIQADTVFKRYPVNGVTFGLIQAPVSSTFPLPWYMNSLYSARTVEHLPVPPPDGKRTGDPQGNYQYLEDFKSLQNR